MPIRYKELICPLDISRGSGFEPGSRSDPESGDAYEITHLIIDEKGKIIGGSGIQTRGDHGSYAGCSLGLTPEELAQIEKQEAVARKSHLKEEVGGQVSQSPSLSSRANLSASKISS